MRGAEEREMNGDTVIGIKETIRDQYGNTRDVFIGAIPEAEVAHGERIAGKSAGSRIAQLVAEAKERSARALQSGCRCPLCLDRLWDLVERNNETIEEIQRLLDGQTAPAPKEIGIGSRVRFIRDNLFFEGEVKYIQRTQRGRDTLYVKVGDDDRMFRPVWKDCAVLLS